MKSKHYKEKNRLPSNKYIEEGEFGVRPRTTFHVCGGGGGGVASEQSRDMTNLQPLCSDFRSKPQP